MAAKAIDSLDVYISGRRVGELNQIQGGRLSFVYDDAWMNGRVAIPLSLSMPTIAKSYDGRQADCQLWVRGRRNRSTHPFEFLRYRRVFIVRNTP